VQFSSCRTSTTSEASRLIPRFDLFSLLLEHILQTLVLSREQQDI
jgi:hypothetical protein